MELIYPKYYKDFRCLADNCPDSCCYGWEVEVDASSAARFRALPGALGDVLREKLYDEDGVTYLANEGDRCPMWREDGLCRLQAALGHEGLCQVCQTFPRLRQDYGDFVELGLEMSCPEAARIMLGTPRLELVTQTVPGGEEPEYDGELMALLRRTRPEALALLQGAEVPVPERLARLLVYGHHVQGQIDGGDVLDYDPGQAEELRRRCKGKGNVRALVDFYRELERLTDRWEDALNQVGEAPAWPEALCRLAQYQVYRYYYQAVSDWDLAARIKMIVAGCVLLARMMPGEASAQAALIQLYAKEIENDASNVDALLDGAFTQRALTDENLLALLAE